MFTRKSALTALAFLCLLGFGPAASAQRNARWTYLGEANVDGNRDHDKISIGRSVNVQADTIPGPVLTAPH